MRGRSDDLRARLIVVSSSEPTAAPAPGRARRDQPSTDDRPVLRARPEGRHLEPGPLTGQGQSGALPGIRRPANHLQKPGGEARDAGMRPGEWLLEGSVAIAPVR